MFKIFKFLSLTIVMTCFLQSAQAEPLQVSGSSTVTSFAFTPQDLAEIKPELDVDFNIITSSSGRGLHALIEGNADIAMISSDIKTVAKKLKDKKNIDVNFEDYTVHKIQETKIDFIVNPQNSMTEITKEQATNFLTGQVKSWKDVGVEKELGAVKIVTEHPTGGMYSVTEKQLAPEKGITDMAVNMQNGPQVAIVVSQVPGAFGFVSEATTQEERRGTVTLNTTDFEIIQQMYFVTKKGDERENVMKFIEFIQNRTK